MQQPPGHVVPGEVRDANLYSRKEIQRFLAGLTNADYGRLLVWSRRFEPRCNLLAEDLVQKAAERLLKNSCRRDFKLLTALCGKIKSVADAERRRSTRHPLVNADEKYLDQLLECAGTIRQPSPEDQLIAREQQRECDQAKEDILQLFLNPRTVRLVIEAQLDGITKPREIVKETGLTPNEVDAARKRLKRARLRIAG
jgi:DNA-directed RNA polymerase specialized sigma24 family protein